MLVLVIFSQKQFSFHDVTFDEAHVIIKCVSSAYKECFIHYMRYSFYRLLTKLSFD